MQLEEEQKCLLKELQTAVERQEDKEHLEDVDSFPGLSLLYRKKPGICI